MLARKSDFTAASVWRSDYGRYYEIYGVAGDYSKRLRTQLIKASHNANAIRTTRDSLFNVVAQIDAEQQGK